MSRPDDLAKYEKEVQDYVLAFKQRPNGSTPAQFIADDSLVPAAFVKRMGVEYSIFNSIGVATVLANTSVGGVVSASSATPINVTLPPTAGVPNGATVEVVNAGSGAVTILASGSDTLTAQHGGVVPVVLALGDNAYFVKVSGEWRLRGGSAALKYAAVMSGPNWTTQPRFDNTKSLATTEFVQRALGNMAGYIVYGVSTALTAADVGKYIYVSAASITLTLPDATLLPAGVRFYIQTGSGSNNVTVTSINGSFGGPNGVPGSTTHALSAGMAAEFISTGAGWMVVGGSGVAALAANGYQKLPSGLIEQWGTASVGDNSESTVSLPVAFPNAILGIIAGVATAAAAGAGEFATAGARKNGSSLSTILVNANTGPTTAVTQTVTWRAWGN